MKNKINLDLTKEFIENLFIQKKILNISFDKTKDGFSDYSKTKIFGVVTCNFILNGTNEIITLSFKEYSDLLI